MLHSEVYEAAAEAITVAPRRAARARAGGNREVGRLELEEGGDDGFLADVELTPRERHPSEFDDEEEEEISLLNELEPSPREREARREAGLPMRRWRHRQRGTPLRVKIWLIALVLALGAFAASGAALAPRVAAWLGGGSYGSRPDEASDRAEAPAAPAPATPAPIAIAGGDAAHPHHRKHAPDGSAPRGLRRRAANGTGGDRGAASRSRRRSELEPRLQGPVSPGWVSGRAGSEAANLN